MASRRAALFFVLLSATACREGAEATLTRGPDGALVVSVEKAGDGRTCLTNASIAAAGSEPDAPVAWAVGRTNLQACARAFRIGVPQPGFEQRTTAALQPGRAYCLTVHGVGFGDAHPFTVAADGTPSWAPRGPQDGC